MECAGGAEEDPAGPPTRSESHIAAHNAMGNRGQPGAGLSPGHREPAGMLGAGRSRLPPRDVRGGMLRAPVTTPPVQDVPDVEHAQPRPIWARLGYAGRPLESHRCR